MSTCSRLDPWAFGKAVTLRFLRVGLPALAILLGGLAANAAQKPDWQAEWEKTVAAAKQEGQLNLYLSGFSMAPIESGAFQKAYPNIKVVTVPLPSGSMVGPRVLAEQRAGKYLADITNGPPHTLLDLYRAGALKPIKPALLLPEVADESHWWEGKHRYTDPERNYVFWYLGVAQSGGIAYNTTLVNPKEFKSLWDFVNPRWKGKIVANDLREGGGGTATIRMFYHHPDLGPEFIKRLFEMDITLSRNRRQMLDWLGVGKFPICLFCQTGEVMKAKSQGLPVDLFGFMKEGAGLTAASGSISLPNRAPHPNAAKLYLNWFLSREGQLNMQTEYAKRGTESLNSLRMDIPKDMVPEDMRLKEGVQYLEVEIPERTDLGPSFKIINEALAQAEKRKKEQNR